MKVGVLCSHVMPYMVKNSEEIQVETPYGAIGVHVVSLGDHEVFFVYRHGENSSVPPHKVNYRGNIQALASSHVSCIFSVGTVGSLKRSIRPGEVVIPHDFLDVTKARPQTFFDDRRVHVDMSEPFCESLRSLLLQSCTTTQGIPFHDNGVCLVTEGPRLETAAEIQLYSSVADVVSMTLSPEVVLSREKGICYASLCLVCNMAAGLQQRLTADEISSTYKKMEPKVSLILQGVLKSLEGKQVCRCPVSLSKASL